MKGAIDLAQMQSLKRESDTLSLATSAENPKTGDWETRQWILKASTVPAAQKWESEIRSSGTRAGAPAFTVAEVEPPRVDYGGQAAAEPVQVGTLPWVFFFYLLRLSYNA